MLKASVYVHKRPCEARRQGAAAAAPRSNFCSRARGNANNGSEHEVAVWLNKSENCESALAGGGGGGGDGGVAVELRFVPHSKESEIIFLLQGCYMEPSPAAMYIKHWEMGKTGSNWRTEQAAPAAAHLALKRALFAALSNCWQIEWNGRRLQHPIHRHAPPGQIRDTFLPLRGNCLSTFPLFSSQSNASTWKWQFFSLSVAE